MPDGNGTGRLDRIERVLESLVVVFDRMREEHDRDYKQLMTAQVSMQDNLRILTENMQENQRTQTENQKHSDQRVDKLVSAVGEFIRIRDNPSPLA